MEPIEQNALTLVVDVLPGKLAELDQALAAGIPFSRVATLHFARVVVLPSVGSGSGRLALETNFDGGLREHVEHLFREVGPALSRVLAFCKGFDRDSAADPASFRRFVDAHTVANETFYVAHRGLSVAQIHNDASVRRAITRFLDDAALRSQPPRQLRAALCKHLAGCDLVLGPVERGLPRAPWCYVEFGLEVLVRLPYLLFLLALSPVFESRDRDEEARDPVSLEWDAGERIDRILSDEDAGEQNGLTHLSWIKPGWYRAHTLRAALWAVQHFALRVGFKGDLAGLSTIHFARWAILDDGRLLFFSNYDGSWESYLGDFIDKVAFWLTVVWTNAKGFPPTRWLIAEGAAAEEPFKRWTRTFQLPNGVWYSAYPGLSVDEVLENVWIRERCQGDLDERDTREWLSRL